MLRTFRATTNHTTPPPIHQFCHHGADPGSENGRVQLAIRTPEWHLVCAQGWPGLEDLLEYSEKAVDQRVHRQVRGFRSMHPLGPISADWVG